MKTKLISSMTSIDSLFRFLIEDMSIENRYFNKKLWPVRFS